MKVSVVIPTYNERENIKDLIHEISDVFEKNGIDGNLIVIDDSSPDGTAREVENLRERYPIVLIKRGQKLGIGSAYVTGFKKAIDLNSDIIFEMDADFSHDPEYIPEFVKSLNNYDLVLGSRYIKGGEIENWSLWRKMMSKGANILARILLGLKVNDITTGYRAYRKETLQGIDLDKIKSNGYEFQAEILFRVVERGFGVKEIPIVFVDRRAGRSKLSKIEIINFFIFCIRTG
ncbi:MAG: polyprenol monophosphomannose synthase, partial [Candidatus Altiarchaeales archaeon]